MNIGEWYIDNQSINNAMEVKLERGKVRIGKKESVYSEAEVFCDIREFHETGLFDFKIGIHCVGLEYKLLGEWYDKEGESLKREYLKCSETVHIMEGVERFVLSVVCYGSAAGTVTIENASLVYRQAYQPRRATLSALTIDYGFEHEHHKRTGEDNLRDSLGRIDNLLKHCRADLVVLTECFYSRNAFADGDVWLSIDSPQIGKMCEKAKQHQVYLAFSFREKTREGLLHNTALLIDREGKISAVYRKTHLTVSEYEDGMTPGTEAVVVDTDFGKVGFAICWDFFFPEFCRLLQLKGAEIIINPSYGFMQEQSVMRARDNGVYVINCGVTHSTTKIFNPEGTELAAATMGGAAIAEVDLNEEFLVRYLAVSRSGASRKNIYRNERRPDLYKALTE